jgi:Protein of unknown function (DUF3352)
MAGPTYVRGGALKGKWIAISMTAVVLLGAAAVAGYRIYLNEVEDDALELVPPDAVSYANVYLNPSTRQKQALRDLLRRFPVAGTPDEARSRVEELLDDALAGLGLEFARDVEPWLGRQVGLFVRVDEAGAPKGALLIATTDPDAATDAVRSSADETGGELESRTYKEVDYDVTSSGVSVGIVDGFLVLASRPSELRASVDAVDGTSLGDTDRFAATTGGLREDRIGLFYANLEPYTAILARDGSIPSVSGQELAQLLGSPAAAVAYLRSDGIVLDGSFPGTLPEPGDLGALPATAALGLAIADFGGFLEGQLELAGPLGPAAADIALQDSVDLDLQDDVLPWIGEVGFYASGSLDEPQLAFVIESLDVPASERALRDLRMALITRGVGLQTFREGGRDGFEARPGADLDAPPIVVTSGEEVVVASSRDEARRAVGTAGRLAQDPLYQAAMDDLGEGFLPGAFARVDPIVAALQDGFVAVPPSSVPSSEVEIARNLEPFSFIIYGSRRDGDRTTVRLVIGVE